MEEAKPELQEEDFDKIVKDLWAFAREHGGKSWELWPLSVLVRSVERLKVSMEESSRQANRLSRLIKNLTWALVGLTLVLVGLAFFAR